MLTVHFVYRSCIALVVLDSDGIIVPLIVAQLSIASAVVDPAVLAEKFAAFGGVSGQAREAA